MKSIYAKCLKRVIDFMLALLALIFFSLVLLILWLFVRKSLGSPAIFKQERMGKDQKNFTIYKFRTMTDDTDENGNLLPDDQRRTKVGSFLRSTGLDELPELVNILKGDLSIVGPRPLLPEYISYYTDYEKDRFLVRGGLVPPEVLYNNVQPTWEEQFTYEVEYARNLSLILDIKVLFAVFKGLFSRYKKDYGEYSRRPLSEERSEKEKVKEEVAEKK